MKHPLAALAAMLFGLSAPAHEGHDHGAEAATPAAPVQELGPRLEASSPDFELVAALEGGHLVIWLDRHASNEPVTRAKIEVDSPQLKGSAAARPDGSFALPAPALAAGDHPLVFSIESAAGSDLLNGVLRIAAGRPAPVSPALRPWSSRGAWLAGAGGLLLAALLAWRTLRQRRTP